MKHKILSLMLAAVMALGLVVPAMAYSTPDFTDVPAGNWAYDSVMRMADRGIVKGTGNKMFSPNGIATAEQFLTLVGRVVFPEIKAEGSDWSGPYVAEAKDKGLLVGTNVTDANLKGEISRYDMAVVLAKAVELLKVSVTKADSSKVTDYGEVPTKYVDAVLTAYGSGLITGDENHNFNGQKSMRRNELATVMDRLLKLSAGNAQGEVEIKPEKPEETEKPVDSNVKYPELLEAGCHPRADYDPSKVELVEGDRIRIDRGFRTEQAENSPYISYSYFRVGETYQFTVCKVPAGYGYTKADVKWESSNEQIATVDQNGVVTMVGPGSVGIYAKIPVRYYNDHFVDDMDAITIYVDP